MSWAVRVSAGASFLDGGLHCYYLSRVLSASRAMRVRW
jgi:hypothetical protein